MPETNATKNNSDSTATPEKKAVKRATVKNKSASSPLASLKQEHKALRAVIRKAAQLDNQGRALVEEVAALWVPHTIIEETILVPLLEGDDDRQEHLNKAQVQRDLAKLLVADLLRSDEDETYYAAKCAAAMDLMTEIMDGEEQPRRGLFALVAKVAKADDSLGRRIEELRGQIQQDAEEKTVFPPAPLSLRDGAAVETQSTKESDKMPRQSERDRDERGRFTSDDDDRGSRSSSRSSSRYDDRDRNYSSRSRDDDDRNGGSRSSSGGGRDTGGWFGDSEGHAEAARRGWRNSDHGDSGWYGDSEGHSEASRRGWEGRTSSRSSNRDDDDDRRSRGRDDDDRGSRYSRSNRDDDDRRSRSSQDDDGDRRSSRSSRDEDDDRRYGRSSRDDEDDDRRGGSRSSGRFDDDRGNRSSRSSRDDDDDRRSSSRSRSRDDNDDDRRGSRSGSNPGWRGDSEGHAEAARRGWENRR